MKKSRQIIGTRRGDAGFWRRCSGTKLLARHRITPSLLASLIGHVVPVVVVLFLVEVGFDFDGHSKAAMSCNDRARRVALTHCIAQEDKCRACHRALRVVSRSQLSGKGDMP
ncbi:hypothetical protein HAX54_011211 [Datura stramonium]|uniref:Uncharacterized protein n=1 Tax=Datura stramonium TaxID=4076 RepID=A0ABS8TJE7_DATST|nr:hypothetical protein [Datura stramonium]